MKFVEVWVKVRGSEDPEMFERMLGFYTIYWGSAFMFTTCFPFLIWKV